MNSKLKFIKLLALFLGVSLIGCVFWIKFISGNRGTLELTQKSIWADLQSIEYGHRSYPISSAPVLVRGQVGAEKYDVLGLPTNDKQFPFMWIVLGANAGANGFFAMPKKSNFTIDCSYLDKLGANETIDDKVRAFLEMHCVKS